MGNENNNSQCWLEPILLDATGIIYCVTDLDLLLRRASLGFAKVVGLAPRQILGLQLSQLLKTPIMPDMLQDQKVIEWRIGKGLQSSLINVFCQKMETGWTFLGISVPENDCKILQQMTQVENELINLNRTHQKTIFELEQLRDKLKAMATTDDLTGAFNRRYFFQQAEQLLIATARYQKCFSIIFFDLDHFKAVNDTYGHPAGDQVLRQVAATVKAILRAPDIFARYGGEEFSILAPETNSSESVQLAERIRQEVAQHDIDVGNGTSIKVTISIGVAEYQTDDTVSSIIARADQGVYRAKDLGRNCVVLHK